MKKWNAVLLLFVTIPAFAAAPSLKDNMKAIGKLFKAVKLSVADSAQNSANAKNADQMLALFQAARNQIPDAIAELPAPSQAAALADFQRLIDAEIAEASELKADFLANNNSAAAGVVTRMNSDKSEGHDKYNPN